MSGHNPNPDFGNQPPIRGRDFSWQERSLNAFILKIDEYYSATPGGFQHAWIDQVTPSGGKTVGSIKKAAWLIDQGLADYVVWVVPRNSIKGGFDDDSKLVELPEREPSAPGDGDGSGDILRGIAASLEERSVMLEGDDYTRWDRPASKILGLSSPVDRLQRHNVLKVLRLGEEAGEISLEQSPGAVESVFSEEEQARRYWEEGLSAINQGVAVAARDGQEVDRRIIINQCKRVAGMGKIKIDDLLASHTDPVKVTKAFYQSARRFLAEMKARKAG